MKPPSPSDPEKESVVVYNISQQLEAELLRRARDKGTDPAEEAASILEDHARETGEMD